jgi:hypothetical protein
MFIISVLKVFSMKMNRLVPVLFLLLVIIAGLPASASLSKVAAGAPVFIGERNIDISSGLNGHSVIAWWPEGSDRSGDPTKTVTIPAGSEFSYTLDPAVFTGYTGTWYTHDTKPDIPVFVLYQPQYTLSVWDVDANKDITGQSVPMSANITYRIDTNLYMALDYAKRPNYNPSDGFYTVKLKSPTGANIPQIYTGNVGASTTQILKFDSSPFIKTPTYSWANGPAWDRNALNPDSSTVYQTGTYTFVATQDLNHMSESYSGTAAIGTVTSGDKTITFIADAFTTSPTVLPSLTAPQGTNAAAATTASPQQTGSKPAATTVPVKTTFTPLPAGLALAGLGIAAVALLARRKY